MPHPFYMFVLFHKKLEDKAMQFANEAKHRVRLGLGWKRKGGGQVVLYFCVDHQ